MSFKTFKKAYINKSKIVENRKKFFKKLAYNKLYSFVKNIDDYIEDATYSFKVVPSRLYKGEYFITVFQDNKKLYELDTTDSDTCTFTFRLYDEAENMIGEVSEIVGGVIEHFLCRILDGLNPFKVAFTSLEEHIMFVEYIKSKAQYNNENIS